MTPIVVRVPRAGGAVSISNVDVASAGTGAYNGTYTDDGLYLGNQSWVMGIGPFYYIYFAAGSWAMNTSKGGPTPAYTKAGGANPWGGVWSVGSGAGPAPTVTEA